MDNQIISADKKQAVALTERIRASGTMAASLIYEMCRDLRTILRQNLFVCLGYEKFEDYTEKEFNIKKRQAYTYIEIYEKLGSDFIKENAFLGVTKLSYLTMINSSDCLEIMEENDLSCMTSAQVKELVDKCRIQGEQLSLLETEKKNQKKFSEETETIINNLKSELSRKNKYISELENRPADVAVAEPVIREVPDLKAIEEKDRQIKELKEKYDSQISEMKKLYENKSENVSVDRNSFKKIYSDTYKDFQSLVELIKNSDEQKELYKEKTFQLIDVLRNSVADL